MYAPVSGEVIEVNSPLEDQTQLINESPYDDGWIAVMRMDNPSEAEGLMTPSDYGKFLGE